jgi:hypothetical protein
MGRSTHQSEDTDPRDSVLTMILAMILGSCELPQQPLMMEHVSIVKQWESYFGRLPPLPKPGSDEQDEPRSDEQDESEKLKNDSSSSDNQSFESD